MFSLKLTFLVLFTAYSQAKFIGNANGIENEARVTSNEVEPCETRDAFGPCRINYDEVSSVKYETSFIPEKDFHNLTAKVSQVEGDIQTSYDPIKKVIVIDKKTKETVTSLEAGREYTFKYTHVFWPNSPAPNSGDLDVTCIIFFRAVNTLNGKDKLLFGVTVHYKIINVN